MFTQCEIQSLEPYGERGWRWVLLTEVGEREYRTNQQGEGRFYIRATDGMAVQETGLAQWSLPADRDTAAERILDCFSAARIIAAEEAAWLAAEDEENQP